HVFSALDFGFSDPHDSPSNSFAAVVLTTIPASGSLTINGSPAVAGDSVSAAQLAAGQLVFGPAANANGSAYASFTFQVRDDGGTANGGVDLDPSPNTITIDVTEVNDAPTAGADSATTNEDHSVNVDV